MRKGGRDFVGFFSRFLNVEIQSSLLWPVTGTLFALLPRGG